jgi:O-antigen/teichoic acid export membrane protein
MSLKSNIAANYASQLYTTLIGVALVPVYLQTMGSEAYGLVGFFAMLQAWFNLLDLGLTPTIARESARYHAGALSVLDYRRTYRALSLIFMGIALAGGAALFGLADVAAGHWLKLGELAAADVVTAVQIMAACVALRWMGGLYRGVVSGAERLVWLSGFNAVIATLRFVAVLASMWLWGFTPTVFFWHQLAVAALEWAVLLAMCHRLLPQRSGLAEGIGWSFKPVQALLRFALSIAFTSSVWVLVTQTDKLILSGILPLADYGYFTLAVLAASVITIVSAPISTALMPRMARLHAEGRHDEVRRLYGQSAQLVSVIAGSLAVTLAVCPQSLLFAWSGNREVTDAAAPILRLYAVGNGLLALGAFPYYLQYARGDLRYHLIGNVVLALVLVPAIAQAAVLAGAVGAGWAWVAMNAAYLLLWVGYVHLKLEPGLHWRWLANDVLVVVLPTLVVGLMLSLLLTSSGGRLSEAGRSLTIALACLLAAALASPLLRSQAMQAFRASRA